MDGDKLHFNGQDEVTHWKNMATFYKEKAEQVEREFEDFQENSQMLERELEAAVEQAEKRERNLGSQNCRLQSDLEKARTNQIQADTRIGELESKVVEYRCQEEKLIKYIRDLEQKNDDLERSQRALLMSLGENEAKLNSAIERNAFLESEQDEAGAIVQRLKDETRDLREEMNVRVPDNDKSLRSLLDSNKMKSELPSTPPPASPLISKLNSALRRTKAVGRSLSCVPSPRASKSRRFDFDN